MLRRQTYVMVSLLIQAFLCTGVATSAPDTDPEMIEPSVERDEVRSLVAELMADAETRSSLLQSGNAGHDSGFFLASPDNAFRLNVQGVMQFRYLMNFRDDDGANDDFESGFQNARTLLFFKGHVYSPQLGYQVRMNFSSSTGESVLDDAFVTYTMENGLRIRWGQGLMAFSREWYYGDIHLQGVERSLSALMFGEQRAQLVELRYQQEDYRLYGTFSNGFRSQNTDLGSDPADWAVTGRFEWKLDGDWSRLAGTYASPRGSSFAAALGGAVHFEQGPAGTGAPAQDLVAWTADLVLRGDGWNIFAAATGYHTKDEAGVSGADFDEYGLVGQAGLFVADDWEVYGRYDLILPDGDRIGDDPFNGVSLGVNWYLHGQAARFTLEGSWYPDATSDTVAGNFGNRGGRNPTSSLFGVFPSEEDNQFTIRAQFQLIF